MLICGAEIPSPSRFDHLSTAHEPPTRVCEVGSHWAVPQIPSLVPAAAPLLPPPCVLSQLVVAAPSLPAVSSIEEVAAEAPLVRSKIQQPQLEARDLVLSATGWLTSPPYAAQPC